MSDADEQLLRALLAKPMEQRSEAEQREIRRLEDALHSRGRRTPPEPPPPDHRPMRIRATDNMPE
jgi:hypothetical protein